MEGVRNINEAIKNGWKISSFIYTREKPLSRWAEEILSKVKSDINYELTFNLMKNLSGKVDTSEILAVVKMRDDDFSQFNLSPNPVITLFDRPSNHGNLGTIIRSCDAFGIDGLIITGHGVDLYEPDVIAASMGSIFKVPVIRIPENKAVIDYINEMKKKYSSFQTIGTTAHHETNIVDVDFRLPTLIMIGNETKGLSKMFRDECDILATIPLSCNSSASSFNVACAATVLFYEAVRQRS